MASAAGTASIGQPTYRSLDRHRNEIRLLKILPPSTSSSSANPLQFSRDVVRCEMQYHSLDDLIGAKQMTSAVTQQKNTSMGDEDGTSGIKSAALSREEHKPSSHATQTRATGSPVSRERLNVLLRYYLSQEEYFKTLVPHDDWESNEEEELFAYWMRSWIWTPLAEKPEENGLTAYIALSYVWSRQPNVPDDLARLLKLHRIFQDISPACANLLAKEIPSVTQAHEETDEKTEIILDGVRITVGKNLESAIRALREMPDVQLGMLVWADALCINQNDIHERNCEVKRMDSIYSHATRVASWLSESDNRHVRALEFMNVVG